MPEANMEKPAEVKLRIAWTTVETPEDANRLAHAIMESRQAACVQIDGPVRSLFHWEGKLESSNEVRLWIKYPKQNESALQKLVDEAHPYEVPQWVAVDAVAVMTAYGEWASSVAPSQ
ncbi:divalent-cation tolerance protein CutA [Puniceicoccales bacterium CK1056]|uniref:Divalent-cation tolerance protein CutA n=1 Tax=Oceanipulchritudo coccoides TaxID=2706888 RepID=A0A6B2M2D9_9BACT|nr:divalent-cation tolerance protein CutA [Oceanipulchritudo coccoides]NDV63181.1 divalent-cation tolerance protein CutA [Oceanipulchritudo coccoides]